MTIDAQWSADLAAIVADLPAVLTWSGQTISGTASHVTRTDDVYSSGELTVSALEWVGPLASFTASTLPQVRDVVTVGGTNYHVTQRTVDAAGVSLVLRRV